MIDLPLGRSSQGQEDPKPSLASNIVAIIGFIILIVVVIWGLVHLAGISRTWLSSLFGSGTAAIEVSAPENATSGSPFTLSWQYDEPTEGTYALLYQCQDGLGFQTPSPVGVSNGIPCGAAFALTSDSKEVSLTPFYSGINPLAVPLTVLFMPTGTGTEAQGNATVEIAPVGTPSPAPIATPAPSPIPAPTPTPAPTPAPVAPATPADLAVRIISVSVDGYGNGVATFDITNVGGTASGSYYFTASLPTASGYAYTSPTQTSLAPGAHIENTLRFSDAYAGVLSVSVVKADANAANNYASQTLGASSWNTNNYYLPTGQAGNTYPYQTQYSSAYYPYSNQPYQSQPYLSQKTQINYRYIPGQGWVNVYSQVPVYLPTGQAGGGTPYTQYSPYSAYYPYVY